MKISVLGGGISGLVAAYNLSLNRSAHVSLYEASDRFGGWIQTRRTADGGRFELGPHSLRCTGPSGNRLLELIDEVALNQEVVHVTKDHPAAQVRYIGLDGQLVALPSGVKSLLSHQKRGVFLKAIVKDLLGKGRYSYTDESVYMFFERRFGREVADLVADPMCRGISASSSRTLGAAAMFPSLVKGEFEHRSIIKSLFNSNVDDLNFEKNQYVRDASSNGWRMLNFKHGMEQLPKALLNILKDRINVDVYENSPIEHVTVTDPEVTVTVQGGKPRHCDHVVSALPAFSLAQSIAHPELEGHLAQIAFVNVAHVSLEFSGANIDLQAFGCLLPSYENPAVLGIIFDSCIFPLSEHQPDSSYRLSLMLGGEWFQDHFGDPALCDRALVQNMALDAVKQYLGVAVEPSRCDVDILEKCIPHYTVGHRNRVKHLYRLISEQRLRLSLIGASFNGAGVPDCINSAIEHTEPLHTIMNERYFGYSPVFGEDDEENEVGRS